MQSQESNFKYETSEMSLQTPTSSGGSLQRPYPLSGSSEALWIYGRRMGRRANKKSNQ